ncbi:MAG: Cys-Gln thioester bond-forming surface protein, partial [Bacilli bacterium]|nr:Cys-Gln thioester bond-forming surface protein [Bacilli bacterium]
MIKKIIKIVIAILCLFVNMNVIKADEEYWISKRRYQNIYGVFDGYDRVHLFYAQGYIINNEQAYCLEPGVAINTNYYSATEDLSMSGLSEDVIKKTKLIGYYGFNYPGHSNNRYFMAAQEMIWKAITGRETYWVSEESIDGPRINIDNEKQVIKDLMDTHYTKPSFDSMVIDVSPGDTYTLTDTNNVLSRYKILESTINNIEINNNTLTFKPESITDSGEIKLISKLYTDKVALLYYKDDNQKLISSTSKIDEVVTSFKVRVVEKPYLKVIKVEDDTGRDIHLSGITFKIKKIDTNEYVCENDDCTFKTNNNGYFITKNVLDYGNYQIEELDNKIEGYLWNKEPLKFTIDESSEITRYANLPYVILKFKNKKVTGTIEVNKVGEKLIYKDNIISYQEIPLSNVIFNLYAGEDIYTSNGYITYHKDDFIGS